MIHRFKWMIAGAALLAGSGVAHAQAATGEIGISSVVAGACGMGTPNTTVIDLLDLTGPGGTLDSGKTGSTVLGTATISDAWCNGPHSLALVATPMTLTHTPAYAQPNYMARHVTFDGTLVGWGDTMTIRPHFGGDISSRGVSTARAAPAPGLQLQISSLQTLRAGAEVPNLMLEAGSYRGTVTIRMTAN